MQDNKSEMLPLVDRQGNTVGAATRGECHSGSHLLHPVVHLHVFNSRGELYLQRRPGWKDIQPGKWDTAVGGHIDLGEDAMAALLREAREEIGITGFTPVKIAEYIFESDRESEYVNVFATVYDGPVAPSQELDGGCFFTVDAIMQSIRPTGNSGDYGNQLPQLTPNFAQEFIRLNLSSLQLPKMKNFCD